MNRIKKAFVVILALVLILVITLFFVSPVQITGHSMEPNYLDGSIYLVLNKVVTSINRGDVVTYVYSENSGFSPTFVSRIVGLPGDKIRISDGKVYVNDKLFEEPCLDSDISTSALSSGTLNLEKGVTVSTDTYFLLSDKRNYAKDSRTQGFIHKNAIKAKLFYKLPIKGSPSL